MSYGLDCRGDFKTTEVCTAEYITGVRWSWDQAYMDGNGCV